MNDDVAQDKVQDASRTLDENTERIVAELTTRLLQPLANSVTGALNEAIPTLEPALAELQRPVQPVQNGHEHEERLEIQSEVREFAQQTQQQLLNLQVALLQLESKLESEIEQSLEKSLEKNLESLDSISQSLVQSLTQNLGQSIESIEQGLSRGIEQSAERGRSESLQAFQAIQDALAQFEQRLGQRVIAQFEQKLEQKLEQRFGQNFDRELAHSLQGLVKELLIEDRRTLASVLTPSLSSALVSSLAPALSSSVSASLTSSLTSSLVPTIAPALSPAIAPALEPALAEIKDGFADLKELLRERDFDNEPEVFEPVLNATRDAKRLIHDGFATSANNANHIKIVLGNAHEKLESIIKLISDQNDKNDKRNETEQSQTEWTLLADEISGIRTDLTAAAKRSGQDKRELLGAVNQLSDTISKLSEQVASQNNQTGQGDLTRQLLEVSIPGWEGMLRAHNQAQSRELDTLSSELVNSQSQTETTILQTLQETLHTEFATHVAVLDRRAATERLETAKWNRGIKRILWVLAGFTGLSILFSIASLIR